MIHDTRSISILADARRRGTAVAVALAALALLGAVAAAGTATAQSDRPTIVVTDGSTAADGTTTVGVVLTSAPDGLAGYYLELTVENPEVARIDAAGYPDRFGLTSQPVVEDDGTTVLLEAADMEGAIEPGATDVTLATVTVAGAAPGEVELSVEPRQFDADDGSAVSPATRPGTVTVTGGSATSSTDDATSESDTGGDTSATGGGDTSADTSGGDGRSDTSADTTPESTSGAGPLSPVLVLVAIGVLAAVGRHRT